LLQRLQFSFFSECECNVPFNSASRVFRGREERASGTRNSKGLKIQPEYNTDINVERYICGKNCNYWIVSEESDMGEEVLNPLPPQNISYLDVPGHNLYIVGDKYNFSLGLLSTLIIWRSGRLFVTMQSSWMG
jgi:hypothetical protein